MGIFICDLYSNHGKNRPNMPLVEGGMKMRYVQNFHSMVKLVLVGDFLQLPPVPNKTSKQNLSYGGDRFIFQTELFKQVNLYCLNSSPPFQPVQKGEE